MGKNDRLVWGLLVLGLVIDVWLYSTIGGWYNTNRVSAYFLPVGEGEATLLILPGGKRVLIDGGPSPSVIGEMSNVMPPWVRRIDAVIMTHPTSDRITGLIDVLHSYHVGVVFQSGESNSNAAYALWSETLKKNNIHPFTLHTHDVIHVAGAEFSVLRAFDEGGSTGIRKNMERSVVMKLLFRGRSILFTSNASKATLATLAPQELAADVLKVPRYGSAAGLDDLVLHLIHPAIGVIEVGSNKYGYPAPSVLALLRAAGVRVMRTDHERPTITIDHAGMLTVSSF
ncbi:MAG: hypothetical protein KGI50_02500 [Patescibacteria group bacterium]|nr:hypothetical protein [Patescibacteria group bacterium]MDE2437784.1 hypothetical protein [Patescibacteria group bacterium]